MTETNIRQSLVQFFRDQFNVELSSTSEDLIEAGILDSLMLIEVVAHIEEQFSVTTELDDLEMENFLSIDAMARFVLARLPALDEAALAGEQAAAASGQDAPAAGQEGG